MKRIFRTGLIICLLSYNALGQGLITFVNTSATLVHLQSNGIDLGPLPSGAPGQFNFQLFIAPAGTTDPYQFVPTEIRGTNISAAGRLSGGSGLSVSGVPAGEFRSILVRGWSSSLGSDYATALANFDPFFNGYLGESSIAPNFRFGGFDGTDNWPVSPAFGAIAGIQTGFFLVGVPEPATGTLIGLAGALLLGLPRVRRRESQPQTN